VSWRRHERDFADPENSSSVELEDVEIPSSEEELVDLIERLFRYRLPTVACCPGHVAPSTAVWKLFEGEIGSALVIANRGGGKTLMIALLHYLLARFHPGHVSMSLGAIELQAQRAYRLFQNLLTREAGTAPEKHPLIAKLTRKETDLVNGSNIAIAGGTLANVNGPHPHTLIFDELEVLEDGRVFDESRAMTQGSLGHRALDVITSTRKWLGGRIQRLMDQCDEAQKRGEVPPFERFVWCAFETLQNQPNCGNGRGCDKVVSGLWEDGSPRRLSDYCRGKGKVADGWLELEDLAAKFRQNSLDVWESQFTCEKPSTEGQVLPHFSRAKHTWVEWQPHPELGAVVTSIDWGSRNPNSVLWIQFLQVPVDLPETDLVQARTLQPGSFVVFDEIYLANIPAAELSDMAWAVEEKWTRKITGFRVSARFYDSQGRQSSQDFMRAHLWQPPLRNAIGKNVYDELLLLRELTRNDQLLIANAPNLIEELEAWRFQKVHQDRKDAPDAPVEDFDHSIAALRYGVANVRVLHERRGHWPIAGTGQAAPATTQRQSSTPLAGQSPYASAGGSRDPVHQELLDDYMATGLGRWIQDPHNV
jgi:hypothetical protein